MFWGKRMSGPEKNRDLIPGVEGKERSAFTAPVVFRRPRRSPRRAAGGRWLGGGTGTARLPAFLAERRLHPGSARMGRRGGPG